MIFQIDSTGYTLVDSFAPSAHRWTAWELGLLAVLGLRTSLRRGDVKSGRKSFSRQLGSRTTRGHNFNEGFSGSLKMPKRTQDQKTGSSGQVSIGNMFVHRGRLASSHEILPREHLFYDSLNQIIPRATSKLHLAAIFPDRSEIESLIIGKETWLNEDATNTLTGIFTSCQKVQEETCERLWLNMGRAQERSVIN